MSIDWNDLFVSSLLSLLLSFLIECIDENSEWE
jgi:hypothetical protein